MGKSSSCSIFILINISISFYSPKIYYYVKQNVLCGGPFSVVFLFIFLSVAIDLNAQATLFHNSGLTKANLTTADATKYEYFEYSPDVDGLWLMHLSNFSSQVAGGYLRIKVPGNDTLRRYKARYVQAKPNGNITWYGDLVDDYGQETNGYATLTSCGGKAIGNFTPNDQDYTLYPIKNSLYLFVKEDTDVAYTCGYQIPGGGTQLTGGRRNGGKCSGSQLQ